MGRYPLARSTNLAQLNDITLEETNKIKFPVILDRKEILSLASINP